MDRCGLIFIVNKLTHLLDFRIGMSIFVFAGIKLGAIVIAMLWLVFRHIRQQV
jgi:hypothetical protein